MNYKFSSCTSLTSVAIPNSVSSIGGLTFAGCKSMTFASIGDNVSTIGRQAFFGCTGITRLICKAQTPPKCDYNALYDIDKWNCTLSIPEGATSAYQQTDQWKDFFFIDNDMTKVATLNNGTTHPTQTYDMQGKKLNSPQPGLNIIKTSDGKTKKVMVK